MSFRWQVLLTGGAPVFGRRGIPSLLGSLGDRQVSFRIASRRSHAGAAWDVRAGPPVTEFSGVAVRRATSRDLGALAGMRWEWATEPVDGLPPELTRAEFTERFSAWWRDHERTHLPYVAEVGGGPVAMAWLVIVGRLPEPAAPHRVAGDLQSVYVSPPWRGRGLGTRLITAVTGDAATLGLEHLSVRAGRRSAALYRRLGFGGNGQVLELRPQA